MKFVRQFLIILTVSFVGEILHALIPLPVPASIYGLVLMLIGLQSGVIPLEKVKTAGSFLIEVMPMMFIPAGVGLITAWATLREVFVPVITITLVTTVLVMVATGKAAQLILKKDGEGNE